MMMPWEPFEPTWEAWKTPVNLDGHLNTDSFRQGWAKPTIYREHEVIHILCNLLDKALDSREAVTKALVNAAEFGDTLDPVDVWSAIERRPEDHLSEEAMASFEDLRP